ncbi:hypothetical protein GUJ93_ZPchr0006g43017 [Zizania palustris]|uniref:Uncharacterized protein n=1 Tax=Zizania palustris TaxID=103762 RepID=A0A8J5TFH8_ZIZPA|nr:hypothetical protein GUJ93_ZPchr0006g43017 [Zizania palustris]
MEGDERKETVEATTAISRAQKGAAAAAVSVHEVVQHAWASVLGLFRKVTARSEEEAAEADMRTAKMQVEATDEAEAKKKQLAG